MEEDGFTDISTDVNVLDVPPKGNVQVMTEIRQPKNVVVPMETKTPNKLWKTAPRGMGSDVKPSSRLNNRGLKDGDPAAWTIRAQLEQQSHELFDLQREYNRLYDSREGTRQELVRINGECQNLSASNKRIQESLQQALEERDKLRQQVVELKQGLSAIGHADGQLSDDVLNEETRLLAHNIQNWIVKSTRKLQLVANTENLSEKTKSTMAKVKPQNMQAVSFSKLHIFQAIIARKIMAIFNADSVGLTKVEDAATTLGERIQAINSDMGRYNQWRSTTYTLLYNMSDEQLEKFTEEPVNKLAQSVEDIFCEILNAPDSTERILALRRVLFGAIKLSRALRTQRACIKFKMPTTETFSPEIMHNEYGQEAIDMAGEKVAYVLFPMLVKFTNDRGETTETQSIVSKARAVCLSEIESAEDEGLEEAE